MGPRGLRIHLTWTKALAALAALLGTLVGGASEAWAQLALPTGGTDAFGLYVRLSIGAEWLSVADRTFQGSGIDATHSAATFNARGSDLGMRLPAFAVLGTALGVQWRWLSFGGMLDYAVAGAGNLSTPGDPTLAAMVSPGDASMFLVGGEAGVLLTARPFAVHLLLQSGYRFLTMPVTAYATTTCYTAASVRTSTSAMPYPCPATADGGAWFLRPRVQVEVATLGRPHISIGVYLAGEVLPDPAIAFGLALTGWLFELWPPPQDLDPHS